LRSDRHALILAIPTSPELDHGNVGGGEEAAKSASRTRPAEARALSLDSSTYQAIAGGGREVWLPRQWRGRGPGPPEGQWPSKYRTGLW